MSGLPDLAHFQVGELLRLEAAIVTELRSRGLVRTNNKPLGDIAEQIVLTARGGVLEPNSTKSHDVTTPEGRRIQVKAMGGRAARGAAKFSPFRSFDFDTALFLVFASGTFDLELAREVDAGEVEAAAPYSKHTNGRQPTLRQIAGLGRDVTDEMRAAYASLDDAQSIQVNSGASVLLAGIGDGSTADQDLALLNETEDVVELLIPPRTDVARAVEFD